MKKITFLLLLINTVYCFGQDDPIEIGFVDNNFKGHIKKIIEGKHPQATKHIYTFNTKNLITKIEDIHFYTTRIATYINYNLVKISQDYPNKTFTILNSYKYDSSNRLIEKKFSNQVVYYKYNKLGQLIEKTTYFDDKSLLNKVLYTYLNNRKKISLYKDWNNKTYFKSEKKYNSLNKEIEDLYYYSDEKTIYSKRYTEYDKYGNITKHNPFSDELLIVTYSYKYDSTGNWIEKIEYRNDKEKEKTTRTIEYY